MEIKIISASCVFVIALVACGGDVSGTYVDDRGVTTYELKRDGRARITVLGTVVDAEYTLSGDKVLVSNPQGAVVLTLRNDRLYGPMGLELNRQPGTDRSRRQ